MTEPSTAATPETKSEGQETIEENEIRVTAQGKMRNYVAYAATVFTESKSHTVVLKGMGRVINKTVSLAEILKRRVKGLYQSAEIGSIKVVDKKGGKNGEGPTEITRLLSVIKIVLTTTPDNVEKYQPPIDESMVEPMTASVPRRSRAQRRKPKRETKEPVEEDETKSPSTKDEGEKEVDEKPSVEGEKAVDEKPSVEGEKAVVEKPSVEGEKDKVKRSRRRRPRRGRKGTKENGGASGETASDPVEAAA